MKKAQVLSGLALCALGCGLGVAMSVLFVQHIATASLNARLVGDLSQDVAMFNVVNASNRDASAALSKNRLSSTLVGLKAQWPYLTDRDKVLVRRMIQGVRGKDVEIDRSIAKM